MATERAVDLGAGALRPHRPDTRAAMAAAAAELVGPGRTVALGASDQAAVVARCLLAVPGLTVVTNSLPAAGLLREAARERRAAPAVFLTGGTPTPSGALVGVLAEETIRSLHVDLVILGAHGVTASEGVTAVGPAEARTDRAFIASARRTAVVADRTAWGVLGPADVAAAQEIDCFVTDDALPAAARAALESAVGELVVVRVAR
ncbi:hypothetical protein [Streptomyces sp. NRRL B-24484]|uniref:hypothetical protein n=1 Tax=Streptomyces sp. NRRL B-24484 TaxID=1463833 RepID=UPI000693E73E|nr:hypothetical protein [Streptomyces sp. NRRL B-24484]